MPKEIDEDGFWRNYFFRVNLLKRAFNLSELPQWKEGAPTFKPNTLREMLSSSGSSIGKPEPIEFSDAVPLSTPLKEDEPNISALIDALDMLTSENDALSLPGGVELFNTAESQDTANDSTQNDFIDAEDSGMLQFP